MEWGGGGRGAIKPEYPLILTSILPLCFADCSSGVGEWATADGVVAAGRGGGDGGGGGAGGGGSRLLPRPPSSLQTGPSQPPIHRRGQCRVKVVRRGSRS